MAKIRANMFDEPPDRGRYRRRSDDHDAPSAEAHGGDFGCDIDNLLGFGSESKSAPDLGYNPSVPPVRAGRQRKPLVLLPAPESPGPRTKRRYSSPVVVPDYIDEVFGPGGLFAKDFPGYESRPEQIQLARAVNSAIFLSAPLLGEAPCGTGKGAAYAVPCIYHLANIPQPPRAAPHRVAFSDLYGAADDYVDEDESDRRRMPDANNDDNRAIIVTANIALQHQMAEIDLPRLARILPWKFSFALYKGRSNYLCRRKLGYARAQRVADQWPDAERRRLGQLVLDWSYRTVDGDRARLPLDPSPVWSKFSCTSSDCRGRNDGKCEFRKNPEAMCYSQRARQRMLASDIVVTNYHLLFADVLSQGRVLPPHRIVVMDEAHEAAEIARDWQDHGLSESTLASLSRQVDRTLRDFASSQDLDSLAEAMWSRLRAYVAPRKSDPRLKVPGVLNSDDLERKLTELGKSVLHWSDEATMPLGLRLVNAGRKLHVYNSIPDSNSVYWGDTPPTRIELARAGVPDEDNDDEDSAKKKQSSLRSKQIDVAPFLRRGLFDAVPAVIGVSATLRTNNNYAFISQELGLVHPQLPPSPKLLECTVNSPFDLAGHTAVVLPPEDRVWPNVDPERYTEAVARQVIDTIVAVRGRTLILFTSWQMLHKVYRAVQLQQLPYQLLCQGTDSVSRLAQQFRTNIPSCLFGVASFWAGLDVPGEALSAVVIARIPFTPPTDPIVRARTDIDPESFWHYSVPRAVIKVRQGLGRLIRAKTDRGIYVICDPRARSSAYSGFFMRELPKGTFRTTDVFEAADRVLAGGAGARRAYRPVS